MGVFTRPARGEGMPPPPPDTPRALTAATNRIRIDDKAAIEKLRQSSADTGWQTRAWSDYETVGEIHFAFNLVGNVISRIRFYPAADITPNVAPAYVDDARDLTPGIAEAAKAAMRRISDTNGDFSTLARHAAINLGVPGECYLVQIPGRDILTSTGVQRVPESWEIRSKDEVVVTTDKDAPVKVRARPEYKDSELVALPKTAFVGRIWRRNPRYSALADSSMRAVLDLVDELMLINQTFKATARSSCRTVCPRPARRSSPPRLLPRTARPCRSASPSPNLLTSTSSRSPCSTG